MYHRYMLYFSSTADETHFRVSMFASFRPVTWQAMTARPYHVGGLPPELVEVVRALLPGVYTRPHFSST
jgi:hypothetical protein